MAITGLADALIFCRARYGSDQAVALTHTWLAEVRRAAYLASVDLAKEKGVFPLFERKEFLANDGIINLDDDVRTAIAEHGIRNALLTSIAPTGTISIFADNVSSGLEPVFAFTYRRHVNMTDGSRREEIAKGVEIKGGVGSKRISYQPCQIYRSQQARSIRRQRLLSARIC